MTHVMPLKALEKAIGKKVRVRLKSGVEFRGKLVLTDVYMNLILENCEEYEAGDPKKRLGQAFVRGNNILFVQISQQ